MGNDVAEVLEVLPSPLSIKVHRQICSELLKLVTIVSKISPEIEDARPRCSGMEALCLLKNVIAKANSLLQQCSDSSKLYLALTGDAILSRCKKSKDLMEQSLCQIQNTVPVILAATVHLFLILSSLGERGLNEGKMLEKRMPSRISAGTLKDTGETLFLIRLFIFVYPWSKNLSLSGCG